MGSRGAGGLGGGLSYESVTPDFVAQIWLGQPSAGQQNFRGRDKDEKRMNIPLDQLKGRYWSSYWFEHENMRDERVVAFTQLLWEGFYSYSYGVPRKVDLSPHRKQVGPNTITDAGESWQKPEVCSSKLLIASVFDTPSSLLGKAA